MGGPTVFGDMGLWLGGERYAVALCICGKVPGMITHPTWTGCVVSTIAGACAQAGLSFNMFAIPCSAMGMLAMLTTRSPGRTSFLLRSMCLISAMV